MEPTTEKKKQKRGGGRKSKYNKKITAKIFDLIASGQHTILKMCQIVGITQETYFQWKKHKPEFSELIEKAEEACLDSFKVMAKSGLAKLLDVYEYEETTVEYENFRGQPRIKGQKTVTKKIMPNPTAVIFTLTNTDPQRFRRQIPFGTEAREETEVTLPQLQQILEKQGAQSLLQDPSKIQVLLNAHTEDAEVIPDIDASIVKTKPNNQ